MYSTKNYHLTKGEEKFIKTFLQNNDCGAKTPKHLLQDNFSCQSIESLNEIFEDLSSKQIAGFLSSLINKMVIYVEEREEDEGLPDLYWVNENYLAELDKDMEF